MPTWGEILKELNETKNLAGTGPDFDGVRKRYVRALHELTGRAVIVYATAFLESRPIQPIDLQISLADVPGFMEAASNITERKLDLILHSPGGSAEAAESIVKYLRQRFDNLRVVVPVAAMSAATMVALAGDEIVMGQHSQLGPIDPQFIIQTPEGSRSSPAKAIINQFELAKRQCSENTANLTAWMPILRSYSPGLLTQCEESRQLASTMVSSWLSTYMFADDTDGVSKAETVANWFADYDYFHSHARRVGREQVEEKGIKVIPLEEDNALQDAVLSVHHATMHTFARTGAMKIIENHNGRTWARVEKQIFIPTINAPSPNPAPSGAPALNRAERRRQQRAH